MSTALIAQANDAKLIRARQEAAEAEPKLPSKEFSVILPVHLDYLHIADKRELPPI
jgi:hypothetical protein